MAEQFMVPYSQEPFVRDGSQGLTSKANAGLCVSARLLAGYYGMKEVSIADGWG